ncbi:tripartite tricarboxylate transporter substrate binding protein [Pigmentiphaga soli]|uniref:Tripartite tricarboxylate transporter substrate binding protein n=1 Tax=Pigmentiphaga soli TaxID=1007095 RepID=A0ABP8GFR6_9BURK
MRFSHLPLLLGLIAVNTWAQSPSGGFPSKPIRFVIPSAVGSTPDIGARIAAKFMSADLGQSIIVDNRPGANGVVAMNDVLNSPHDGYSYLVAPSGTMALSPFVYKALAKAITDFSPAGQLYKTDQSLVVRADGPFQSVADIVKKAKEKPGSVTAAYSAPGNISQAALELFKQRTQTDLYSVNFNTSVAAAVGVAAGNADMLFETIAATEPLVRSGKLRRIAMTGRQRSAFAPNIPTIIESGVGDFVVTAWGGVFAPKDAPAANIKAVGDSLARALKNPEAVSLLKSSGLDAGDLSASDFEKLWHADADLWRKTVEASPNLRIEN